MVKIDIRIDEDINKLNVKQMEAINLVISSFKGNIKFKGG